MFAIYLQPFLHLRVGSTSYQPGDRVPVNKDQVHRQVMGEEDIHEKQRGQMKQYPRSEDPPAEAPRENSQRKKKLPQENQRHGQRQV